LDIESALKVIELKLSGRELRTQAGSTLTVEEQVDYVILNAMNEESLKKMFIGWMPWL
jgi:phosphatidylinositol kinase/protein kinase (PI-3  family)